MRVGIIAVIAFSTFINGFSQSNFSLFKKPDFLHNSMMLYHSENKIIKDSLKINNLNFGLDSLIKVRTNLWHYVFSIRCGSNCKASKQLVLSVVKGKLHLSYVGYFHFSYGFDELYSVDTTIKARDIMQNPYLSCDYLFSDGLFNEKSSISEYCYKGKVPDDGSGKILTYGLKYDTTEQVFYNKKANLGGEYTLVDKASSEIKVQIKGLITFLEFKESTFVYIKNKWYELNEEEKYLIEF